MKPSDFAERFPGVLVPIPEGGVAYLPNRLPPALRLGREALEANEAALLAVGELRAVVPSLPNPELFTLPFLRREAVLSSKIEGTQTQLEQLYLFEADLANRPSLDPDEGTADAREVYNYVRALQHGLTRLPKLPISNRLLRELHAVLLTGVRGAEAGEFRTTQNFIGRIRDIRSARFVPPPPFAVRQAADDLERYIHRPDDALPTLVRAALVHYQFDTIHPFTDGNGRLGRLLISLFLAEKKILIEPLLYISAYFERHRGDYTRLLWEVSRAGAWSDWILFFLKGVQQESADAARRARELLNLRERVRGVVQSRRGAASLLTLLDHLFQFPVISVPDAAKILKMSYRGAKMNIEKLQDAEILEETSGRRRNRRYIARPILTLLEAP